MAKGFFEGRDDRSAVKARIIQKYFATWAQVLMPTIKGKGKDSRLAYIDLYAGPGRYDDGSASTPLLVLERAIENPDLCQRLVTLFNDRDANHTQTLQSEIKRLPGIGKLKHSPQIRCGEVDEDLEKFFSEARLVPSFSFVDPFGYRGLSLNLINGVIKDFGCDCVFFFNYNRINPGISNPKVEPHMNSLFGQERAETLRTALIGKTPAKREALILESLSSALHEKGGKFVLPFRFTNDKGTRTSHSLIFVSKKFIGYDIMKQIMAKESSSHEQGVPTLTYSPADNDTPLLFELNRPLDDLKPMLVRDFAGKTISVYALYEQHSVGRRYIIKNYKNVLSELLAEGRIKTNRVPRKGTFADDIIVTFPKA